MADDKKNIPDAGKIDNPPELGKVEQAAPPVQDQPAPAKAEAPVVEDASPVVTPPAAEQPAPAGKEAPKDKDTPAPVSYTHLCPTKFLTPNFTVCETCLIITGKNLQQR